MSAIEDIIKWAQGLPEWQGDAVRRLLEQGELTGDDRDEIFQMVKVAAGIDSECVEPVAPEVGGFSGTGKVLQRITIRRIHEIGHVNAVEDSSTIPFGHEGITVIYGENGSGKSSYARILKRACRARDTKEAILPNVFDSGAKGPATATIKIAEGDAENVDLRWTDGEASDERLTSVTFFDSKCARVIVDDNNEATYIPYGCEVFDGLVTLVKSLRTRLQAEKPSPTEPTSVDVIAGTDSDVFLKNLNRNTKHADIDAAIGWAEADDKELAQLESRIAKSGTPALLKEAKRFEVTANRAQELSDSISKALNGLSAKLVDQINSQLDEITAAKKAVELAAQASLQDEPLPSGTSNEWKLLFEAAKDYSIGVAYPDAEFPATGPEDLCVLCQQPLDEDARSRLKRFQKFMEDKSEQTLRSAEAALKKITDDVNGLQVPRSGDFGNVIDELSTEHQKSIKQSLAMLHAEKDRLKDVTPQSGKVAHSTQIEAFQEELASLKAKLKGAAAQAEKDADPAALKKLEASRNTLVSRRALNSLREDIRRFVEDKKLEFKYTQAIQTLGTKPISEKSKEIISASLSPQLQGDLATELKMLNADHLPLAVNISGREGGARHQITLNAERRARPSDILSEGELSVVAVAGFMAELGGTTVKSPIVLDDPVSSLDHRYSRHIAERLVEEAKERQVIVFTHNIAFLVEIQKLCAGIPLTVQTVRRHGRTPGKCMEGLPWEAMPVSERLNFLDGLVNDVASIHGEDDEKYNKEAAYIYDLLRSTWEAFIEQKLLNATVRRHDIDVRTQQLMQVEIEDGDCKRVDDGMSKCSNWMAGHDKSQALSVNRPAPGELRDDIQELRSFMKEINKRGPVVQKRRKASLKPQQPKLG